ncbi:MAG: CHAT domain-containing tetratricopeptide repeat protein [Bacteroidota bacterium]
MISLFLPKLRHFVGFLLIGGSLTGILCAQQTDEGNDSFAQDSLQLEDLQAQIFQLARSKACDSAQRIVEQASNYLSDLENRYDQASHQAFVHIKLTQIHLYLGKCYKVSPPPKKRDLIIKEFQLALEFVRASSDTSLLIQVHEELGKAYRRFYLNIEQSLLHFFRVLDLRKALFGAQDSLVGFAYSDIAVNNWFAGDFEAGIKYSTEALSIYKQWMSETHRRLINEHNNLALMYILKGEYHKALAYQKYVTGLVERSVGKNSLEASRNYNNMGLSYIGMGEFESALAPLHQAIEINTRIGAAPYLLADHHNSLGKAYQGLNRLKEAEKQYQTALMIRQRDLDPGNRSLGLSYLALGDLYVETEAYEQATQSYQQALDIFHPLFGDQHIFISDGLIGLGNCYQQLGQHEMALDSYQQSIQAILGRNQLAIQNGSHPVVEPWQLKPELIDGIIGKAKVLRSFAQQDSSSLSEVLHGYRWAAELIEKMITGYQNEEAKARLLDQSYSAFEGGIEAAFALGQEYQNPLSYSSCFEFMERSKSVLFRHATQQRHAMKYAGIPDSTSRLDLKLQRQQAFYQLKIAEAEQEKDSSLASYYRNQFFVFRQRHDSLLFLIKERYPSYHQLKYRQQQIPLTSVQKSLRERRDSTAIIEYFWGEEKVYVAIITADSFGIRSIEAPTDSMKAWLTAYREKIVRAHHDFEKETELAHQLYVLLLQPEVIASNTNKLVVIPDGWLNYLAFDLLLMKKPGPQEVRNRDYASLSFLMKTIDLRMEYTSSRLVEGHKDFYSSYSENFAGFAPQYGEDFFAKNRSIRYSFPGKSITFASLTHNQQEVSQAAKEMNGSSFLAEAATESLFKQQAGHFRLLHIAAHAFLNDSLPMFSGIPFTESTDSLDDGFLYSYELYNLTLEAELTVLSACNTGSGKWQRGEGVISLARAFQYAGCRNIVMSLWEADDASTAQIMGAFYRNLKKGQRKSEALKHAKLLYLTNGSNKHPSYWGNFILIGDDVPIHIKESSPLPILLGICLLLIIGILGGWYRKQRQ